MSIENKGFVIILTLIILIVLYATIEIFNTNIKKILIKTQKDTYSYGYSIYTQI